MIAFSPSMFYDSATFFPAEYATSTRGGPSLADPGNGASGVTHRVYVEPFNTATRSEAHRSPEGTKQYSFFTRSHPGTGPDGAILWGGKYYRITADPSDQTSGLGLLFRTEAVLVN